MTDPIARSFLDASSPLLGPRSTDCGRLDGGLVPWHAFPVVDCAAVAMGAGVDSRISSRCCSVCHLPRGNDVASIMSCDWIVAVCVDSPD